MSGRRIVHLAILAAVAASALTESGCASRGGNTPTDPEPIRPGATGSGATQPAATAAGRPVFREPRTGVQVEYPPGWERHPSAEFALLIAPPGVSPADAQVSLDIPDLPPHIPGLIPLGMVRNGYADDVKKAHPGAEVADLPARSIAGAKARETLATWGDGGTAYTERALIVVRGDNVYIVRGTSRSDLEQPTRAGFEAVAGSLAWPR
jgi:hypothetical protein